MIDILLSVGQIRAEIPYPQFDPVAFQIPHLFDFNGYSIGPLPIRWYGIAYVIALISGWAIAHYLAKHTQFWGGKNHPSRLEIDDLLVYIAMGVILGGRLGYVLFYNPAAYFHDPVKIVQIWDGGMSFHGGAVGSALAVTYFAIKHHYGLIEGLSTADMCCVSAPLGCFLGRIANFIKPELWGRCSDVPWAMAFPGAGICTRHPSQLYEAFGEGIVLFLVLVVAVRLGVLRRPGLATGLFAMGYGISRITSEFFREPDVQLGFIFNGTTMGMLLSLPLVAAGGILIAYSLSLPAAGAERERARSS